MVVVQGTSVFLWGSHHKANGLQEDNNATTAHACLNFLSEMVNSRYTAVNCQLKVSTGHSITGQRPLHECLLAPQPLTLNYTVKLL